MKMNISLLLLHKSLLFLTFHFLVSSSLDTDTISAGTVLKDPDIIVSQKQVYKLGFFTPPNTTHRYLGVFFAFSEETVIWVANRVNPLTDSSGAVTLSGDGNLVLIDGKNQTLWSTNLTSSPINSTLQLLDNGNLQLRDVATGASIWESFSQPTNVIVPGMTLSQNVATGKEVALSAWRNASDPEMGSFTAGIAAAAIPQLMVWNDGQPHWRSGPWNGLVFLGIKEMFYAYVDGFTHVTNDSAGNFLYTKPKGNDHYITVTVNSSGSVIRKVWDDTKKIWNEVWIAPENECDVYGRCGAFGSCNINNSPICSCLKGFEPINSFEWDSGNWSSGCRRRKELGCDGGRKGDGFVRVKYMKVPDFAEPFPSKVEGDCRRICLGNCSCIAYAYDGSIGCMFWRKDALIDSQEFGSVGVDLYIRLSASELGKKHMKLYIGVSVVGVVCISILTFVIAWWLMVKRKGNKVKDIIQIGKMYSTESTAIVLRDESKEFSIGELPNFTFEMLAAATDQFHANNLLGRGGFGHVYKGILANGNEIAVKRLSAKSGQGMEEFMNEVIVISKLQHRNLVKLLGGCVEREEKIMIYEYMANKSLDACVFGKSPQAGATSPMLDWRRRYNIIQGIGRGILYLHRDSILKIIHRDLKPSNVLLDEDWNPKISDFGMARIFGGNQDHEDTARVAGTYGYMAPEYATEGRFSEKSDVYSFGMLILEIISGMSNTSYFHEDWSLSISGSAWKMWSEGNGLGFVDEGIASRETEEEMVRCIQIGLLCVQDFPKDRPTIQTLLAMLSREIVDLPLPKKPLFAESWRGSTAATVNNRYSNNDATHSVISVR